MPKLDQKGLENKGPHTGRKLGKCNNTEEEVLQIGALGIGQGKRHHAGGGTGKGKRLLYANPKNM